MNKMHNHVLLSIKNSKKIINLEGTQYSIIKQISIDQLEFQIGVDHYTFLWTDHALPIKQIRSLQYPKRVNHFPDITQITRKNKLAQNLNNIKVHFPKQYDFYPQTWLLPTDFHKIAKRHTKGKIYIVKPENNCQGKGIYLIQNPNKLLPEKQSNNYLDKNDKSSNQSNHLIVQQYLQKPFLINDLKFDLRIYVLITSVQPLRVFLYKEGLARFATQKFEKATLQNLADNFTHLTNYAINKNNEKFDDDQEKGHKRALTKVFQNGSDYLLVMKQVEQIVVKTIISGLPALQNAYQQCKKSDPSSCFQLLGFDIILDQKKKAYLLQVNQNPSLHTDTPIDYKIKSSLVRNIFQMISGGLSNLIFQEKLQNKVKLKDKHQLNNLGDFKRIYPCQQLQETQKYDQFFVKSHELYKQKFGMNIVRNIKRKMTPLNQQGIQNFISTTTEGQKSFMQSVVLNNPLSSGFIYTRQKMQNIYRTKTKFTPYTASMAKRKTTGSYNNVGNTNQGHNII